MPENQPPRGRRPEHSEEDTSEEGSKQVQSTDPPEYRTQGGGASGGHPIPLPNSTTILVLGIVSIPTCCCYGVVGLAVGIIGLVMAQQDLRLYYENPDRYTRISFQNLEAGRVCAIIGVILSALFFLVVIFALIMGVTDELLNSGGATF